MFNLRLSHLFPRQPDGQSHTSGPTHRPPFMHTGSHTPAGRYRLKSFRLHLYFVHQVKDRISVKVFRQTFLASPPGVSLHARADVVPLAHAAVLTGRTADRCGKKKIAFTVETSTARHMFGLWLYHSDTVRRRNREDTRRRWGERKIRRSGTRASTELGREDSISTEGRTRALRNTRLLSPVSHSSPLQPGGHMHVSGATQRPPL